jgi:hypothetical protein
MKRKLPPTSILLPSLSANTQTPAQTSTWDFWHDWSKSCKHFSTTWRVVTTCILAGPLHRIDFWSATGFTLPGRNVRPHLRTVGLCLDQSKGFRYQHSRPPSRLLLLSSWKTGLFCCADARLPGETKSQTMSNTPTTAWRAAVLWYGWRAAPLYHTALRDGFPGVTGLLLSRTAGAASFPFSQLDS